MLLLLIAPLCDAQPPERERSSETVIAAVPRLFPPQYQPDAQGRPTGFAVDVFDRIAEQAGLRVQYRTYKSWTHVFEALRLGQVDVVPNIGISEGRLDDYAFTRPIETFAVSIFVRSTNDDIRGIEDLRGRRVSTVIGNVAVGLMQAQDGVILEIEPNVERALLALLSGEVDAMVYPQPWVWGIAQRVGIDMRIKTVGPPLMEVKRAIAVRKGDEALLVRLDAAAAAFIGTMEYQTLYAKWHAAPKPYWTTWRIIGVIAFLGFIASIVFGVWHYQGMRRLNRTLRRNEARREKAEQALRENEQRLQLALEGTDDGLWDWNIQTGELYVSERWQTMLGYEPGELEPAFDTWERLIHPDDYADVTLVLQAHLDGETPLYMAEYRMRTKSGDWVWIQDRGKVTDRDANDYPLRAVGTHTDITRRKMKQALERSRVARLQRQQAALLDWAKVDYFDSQQAFRRAVELSAATLDVERVSIWMFNEERTAIHCRELFNLSTGRHEHGASLTAGDFPAYFKALESNRTVPVEDARADPATHEFKASYLEPLGITSMMDVPIRLRGRVAGVVCYEHTGERRTWSFEEQDFAASIASTISLAIEADERRWAEQALKLSEEHYRRLVESTSAIPWELDARSWRFTYVGPQAQKVLGYGLAQWYEEGFWDRHVHPEDRAQAMSFYQAAMSPGEHHDIQYRMLDAHGRTVWIRDHVRVVSDGGASIILQGFMFDITQEREMQAAVYENERQLQFILDNLADGVITIDETGEILSFNKTAETMFGYTADEALHQNIGMLATQPERGRHSEYLANYLRTGEAHIIGKGRDVEAEHKSGRVFPMRLSVAELPVGSDGKRRFIGSCFDITQQKLEEGQLRRAQKMDALGKLTGGIAHDYNNMLGVILGYAELLEMRLDGDEKLQAFAREIRHAGERGAKLTRKLLSFSRQQPTEAEATDINALLRDDRHMLERTLTARISLHFHLQEDLWQVWMDRADLEDAVLNMSINAMHAMPEGGRLVWSTANLRLSLPEAGVLGLEPGEYVRLSVSDTGIGIDEQTQAHIFDPFYTTKNEQGTGLGLSQVYGFVQRTEGAIKVYSEPGQGARFSLYFPRYRGDVLDDTVIMNRVEEGFWDGTETILVVDDEKALRELARSILEPHGYRVLSAEDAEQALAILEDESVELMLSDVIMPGMDGHQLAGEVERRYPYTDIVLASGFSEEPHEDGDKPHTARRLLQKPFTSEALLRRVRETLNNRRPPSRSIALREG